MVKSALQIFLMLILCIATASCSYNELGFVKEEVIRTNSATVKSLKAPGLHISKQHEGLRITIGYAQSINVFSLTCDNKEEMPELVFRRSYGVNITFRGSEASVTLGLRESLEPRHIRVNETVSRRIYFEPQDLRATMLELVRSDCMGGKF